MLLKHSRPENSYLSSRQQSDSNLKLAKGDMVLCCPLSCKIISNNAIDIFLDPEDWCDLHKSSWTVKKSKSNLYAYRKITIKGKRVYEYMHRVIMRCPKGFEVHHRNGFTLDNRKQNLEIVNPIHHKIIHSMKRSPAKIETKKR